MLLGAFCAVLLFSKRHTPVRQSTNTTSTQDNPDQNRNTGPHRDGPVRVSVESLPPSETSKDERKAEKKRDRRPQWWLFGVNVLTLIALIIYAFFTRGILLETRKSADAAALVARATKEQVDLQHMQLQGTIGAIIKVFPDFHGAGPKLTNIVSFRVDHGGQVRSPIVTIDFSATKVTIPDLKPIATMSPFRQTFYQVGSDTAGSFNGNYPVPFKLQDDLFHQKFTVQFEGTYSYDDGFGKMLTEKSCWIFTGQYNIKTEEGIADAGGAGFTPCSSTLAFKLDRALRYAHQTAQ